MRESEKIDDMKEINSADQIDLGDALRFFYRNKLLIIFFTFLSTFIGLINAFATKKVWEGEFQIVLEEKKTALSSEINSQLSQLIGITGQKDTLKTEVGILKSPLVLMNVFEFIKKDKDSKNDYSMKDLRFKKWKINQLDIGLEKGTSILNLAYRDTDKDLILPVLNKISENYQEYSGRSRQRELKLGLKFFKDQIEFYKLKNIESLTNAQEYAKENELSILKGGADIDKEIKNNIDVELIRIKNANEIRNVDLQLKQIENLKEPKKLLYIGSLIPGLMEEDVFKLLNEVETKLSIARINFKEKDKSIQDLIRRRENLVKIFRTQVINILEARKINALANLKAAERPKGVLIQYKLLLNEHEKDRATLNKLEEQNRILLLEKARMQEPWELITTPTLLPKPVAPNKIKILSLSLIIGLITGTTYAKILEKSKGYLYTFNEVQEAFSPYLVWETEIQNQQSFEQSIKLFIDGPLKKTKGDISFYIEDNLEKDMTDKFNALFTKYFSNRKFSIDNNLLESIKCENFILITSIGKITKDRIKFILKNTEYQNFKFKSVILVSDINLNYKFT